MDLTLYFFIAISMAFGTWIVGKIWGYGAKEAIGTMAGLAVALPMILIFIVGAFGILDNPEEAGEITSSVIESLINYIADKLPYIVISDVAGITVGRIIGFFTEER